MRRSFAAFTLVVVLSLGAACSSGGSAKVNASSSKTTAAAGQSAVAAGSASELCGQKASLSALQATATAGNIDYAQAIAGLDKAGKAAPAEIRADFTTLVGALKPFFQLLADAKGDAQKYNTPAFRSAAQAVSTPQVKAAGEHIRAYFAAHCG